MQCIALIGDIVGSRKLSATERARLQESLASHFKVLNETRQASLLSPFTLTLGDEFQALLKDGRQLWELVASIQKQALPSTIRFGFGVGTIVTDINPAAALGMDGPAFHQARDAIASLKENGGALRMEGIEDNDLVNPALRLLSDAQSKWRETRFAVFEHYLRGAATEVVAKDVGISKVAVYKNINDGMLATYREILDGIGWRIERALGAIP